MLMEPVVIASDHPLVAHRLAHLRSKGTDQITFGRLVHEITTALAYQAFRDLPMVSTTIDTPVARNVTVDVIEEEIVIIPILRAGLGMVPALQEVLPVTRVCHVGLRRNEATLIADIYLDAIPPDLTGSKVVVCDPMLATGGSLIEVASMVVSRGASDVTAMCLVASTEGVAAFGSAHPTLRLFAGAVDPELNADGYILPGLGDAGDRLFGAPVRNL
jgi:uracil phosphoribosyltransferase